MTAPPLELATTVAGDEPLCTDELRCQGLCRFHIRPVLPQLAEPSWPKMMGDTYVCLNAICDEHAKCLDVPGHAAPRAECGCHNCSQRRSARARAAQSDEPTAAALKAQRRNEKKEAKARAFQDGRKAKALDRLARGIRGGFSVSRPSRLKRSAA